MVAVLAISPSLREKRFVEEPLIQPGILEEEVVDRVAEAGDALIEPRPP